MTTTAKASSRLFVVTTSVLMTMCARTDRVVELPMPPVSTGQAVMHAVHDERLRDVMRGMQDRSFDRLPQELDDPSRERAYLEQTSSRALDLAHTAEQIAAIVDQTGLPPDRHRLFLDLAEQLRDRALELRDQADRHQTRFVQATMEEIDDTCAACHELFRAGSAPPTLGAP